MAPLLPRDFPLNTSFLFVKVINHSEDGVRASMEMAQILVQESRLNNHSFANPAQVSTFSTSFLAERLLLTFCLVALVSRKVRG